MYQCNKTNYREHRLHFDSNKNSEIIFFKHVCVCDTLQNGTIG